MKKKELLELEKLSTLKPADLEKKHTALFKNISEQASSALKRKVERRLKDAPPEVKEQLKKIDFSRPKLGKQKIKDVLKKNISSTRKTKSKGKNLETKPIKIPELGNFDSVLQPDVPVFMNPLFQKDLQLAKMYRINGIAELNDAKVEKIFEKGINLNNLEVEKLNQLVKDKTITRAEADKLSLASGLHSLVDGSFELAEVVNKNNKFSDLSEMVKVERTDWKKWITDSKMDLAEGVTADDYADFMAKKTDYLFPELSLVHKTTRLKTQEAQKNIKNIQALTKNNSTLFGAQTFEELDMNGLTAAQKKTLKKEYEDIDFYVKTNPGLRLDHVINDENIKLNDKGKVFSERLSLMEKFQQQNKDVHYLSLEYKHDSEDLELLNFEGFSVKEKSMLLNNVKAQQRIFSFTDNVEHSKVILAAGYNSSFHITSGTLDDFMKKTKLEASIATKYFENAHTAIIRTTGIMGSIVDILTGSFDWTKVGNIGPSIEDYLREIPGYQDLFGELTFCDCQHCQSIYSPAAYFVDLMQFIERYVINVHFIDDHADHVLNLKTRRPDLWALELNCENTTGLVPSLDIINEILESYIAQKKGFDGDISDLNALQEFVYKREVALEKPGSWKNSVHSFKQPFHLPLASVEAYLGHFELNRAGIAKMLKKDQSLISQARFNLSDKELQLITTVDTSPVFIKRVYDINFTVSGGKITPFNAQDLLKPTATDRKELGRLLKTRFITNEGSDNIVIQGEKKSDESVQNDIERVKNLTYDSLDRLHRFVRLWKRTELSIEELDYLIGMAKDTGISNDLNTAVVTTLGKWLDIKESLDLTVEELAGVIYRLPQITLNPATDSNFDIMSASQEEAWQQSFNQDSKSYFDQLFNHEDVVINEGSYPKDVIKLIHPSLMIDGNSSDAEFSAARIAAALNRSDEEVLVFIEHLFQPLGIVALDSATESDRGFLLTHENLSLIFRHSMIAERLIISPSDLFRFLSLSPQFANNYLENDQHTKAIIKLHQWWKSTAYSLDDLHFILKTGNIVDSTAYLNPAKLADEILNEIAESKHLLFSDNVFAYLEDITESQSKEIIEANASVVELAPDGQNYQLNTAFNPDSAITVPTGINVAEPELRAVLIEYHSNYLIPFYLSGHLNLSEEIVLKLTQAVGFNISKDALILELQNTTSPSVELTNLIDLLNPLSVLFKDKKYTEETISYIIDHLALYGIADIKSISLQNIRKLSTYLSFVKIEEENSNVEELEELLDAYTDADQYKNADSSLLASQLDISEELLSGIHLLASGHSDAIKSMKFYAEVSEVCQFIGIAGTTLSKIISSDYDTLNEAKLEILAAFQSKYPSESERSEKLEKYQDSLRGKKRAALTTYLIHSGFPQFENTNDLYHYFLIDTELEGCARTSRLVAATMSLQLYIHRILLNLEQDDQEPGTDDRVYVRPEDIPADEWDWRKNYRVWEANRKVFLYPENYIEPDLRDNKTPLFEELESELLQQEINADTVLDAYAKYMKGFDEVAHLKVAGSYHEKDEKTETDVLHLFGVTADEPPIYYYRRVENLYYSEKKDDRGVVWEPWQKINVQIPVRKVAPITYNGRLYVFWTRVTSISNTLFDENRSIFTGYDHKVSIEFSTLKLDDTWTTPQKLNLRDCYPFDGNGVIRDPVADRHEYEEFEDSLQDALRNIPFLDFSSVNDAIRKLRTPRYALTPHFQPIDEYTLQGFLWDQVYPYADSSGRLILSGAGYQMRAAIDFYNLSIQESGIPISDFTNDPVMESWSFPKNKPAKRIEKSGTSLYRATSPTTQVFDHFAYGSLIVNTTKSDSLLSGNTYRDQLWSDDTLNYCFDDIRQEKILTLRSGSTIQIVNGAYGDAIIDASGDLLLLQGTPVEGNGFVLKRMSTTISETLTRTLFTSGVDTTLSIATQKALKEIDASTSIPTDSLVVDKVISDKIDWKGAFGTYYREIFFHIPFLLANHLNSQGKYEEAQKWYHYIFNPGANEVINYPAGATAAEKRKLEMDRNWQYLEFREIDAQTLREQLNDKTAIEAYKKDPFNPHAIARLRMSAYQKSIVMKYIDNLLDWGDQLFTQDTMESVNEATLLYVMAKEILGDRPIQIGDCGEGKVSPKNYAKIKPLLNKGSEFLAELESYSIVRTPSKLSFVAKKAVTSKSSFQAVNEKALASYDQSKSTALRMMTNDVAVGEFQELQLMRDRYMPKVTVKPIDNAVTGAFSVGVNRSLKWKKDSIYVKDRFKIPSFGISIIKQISPVFCIPGNKDLLTYYDRVDDRLYKIRNCMNILGQKRQLSLFAPEIDPRLLVRARAAGLSLDDVLNATSGNLPPYRFSYILERAKAFTSVVQSFGSSLFSAIEKRDSQELSLIKMTQQQNILEMSSKSREMDIQAAQEGIKVLNDKLSSLNYQIGYYQELISNRTTGWEIAQQAFKHSATIIHGIELPLGWLAGTLYLIPQTGSPFAMKYGGLDLGGSAGEFMNGLGALAKASNSMAASAGLEAGFDRRLQGWKHQKEILGYEKKQVEKNLIAAEIRRDVLIEAQKIHEKNIENNQEVMDFYAEKFSNLGLYTWLSSTMQRMYKEAYNNALAISRMAEQAFQYERDDSTMFISGSYFDSSKGGLLAGEQLLMRLQAMERRYLETNYRKSEIDQAFSLTQIDPSALLNLKQNGSCTFTIPEIFYDLFYPGQYRRKIKSVRLTIPCVTGPYTNVGATLALTSSKIRMEAKLGNAEVKDVPKSRTTVIATSTAQNDAGVFQLNFQDSRYMPFEGSGAISSWKLDLPKTFKQFDYQTINDVMIHISYTAEYDELFKTKVEEQNDAIEGTLLNTLSNRPMLRTISLRQEFSTDFHRLTDQAINTEVMIAIQNKHFPMFLNGKPLKVSSAKLLLVTLPDQTVSGFKVSVNNQEQSGFTKDSALGNLYSKDLGNVFNGGIIDNHTVKIVDGGDLSTAAPISGPAAALDTDKIQDMIIYLEYGLG